MILLISTLWAQEVVLAQSPISIRCEDTQQLLPCRAQKRMDCPVTTIEAILKDFQNYHTVFKAAKQSRKIADNIVYVRVDMPHILSDRDYTIGFSYTTEETALVYTFFPAPKEHHPKQPSDVVRFRVRFSSPARGGGATASTTAVVATAAVARPRRRAT